MVVHVIVDSRKNGVYSFCIRDVKVRPDFDASVNTDFIHGPATVGDHMVMLLDIDKHLSVDELMQLAVVANH